MRGLLRLLSKQWLKFNRQIVTGYFLTSYSIYLSILKEEKRIDITVFFLAE